ncbi:MAG: arylamine N-acetyltransferase [Firmicutes bacterium]|nr:arylamine N-acetyltransferase [Bacillota bacterium]
MAVTTTMTETQKIDAYLKRIGFTSTPKLDFDTLHNLQRKHLQTIPYENIDILRNVPISLEVDDIFEKIVVRGRGGYCFELNALFAWLLRSLGFTVADYFARFLFNEPEIPMRRHHVLGVSFGRKKYLCDVGVGLVIPRTPIVLEDRALSEQDGNWYKLEEEDFLGYVLYILKGLDWQQLYSFTKEEQIKADYMVTSFWCEYHPDSIFRADNMVHIFTENGRKSIAGNELRIFSPAGVEVVDIATEDEYKKLLKLHFGINL